MNKYDLVTDTTQEEIEHVIRTVNPVTRIMRAVRCDVDLEQITQGTSACFATRPEDVCTDHEYTSLALRPAGRLDKPSFEKWLTNLPKEVMRAKGFVLFEGETGFFEVQCSPAGHEITPMPPGCWKDAVLIVISHPLSAERLISGLP